MRWTWGVRAEALPGTQDPLACDDTNLPKVTIRIPEALFTCCVGLPLAKRRNAIGDFSCCEPTPHKVGLSSLARRGEQPRYQDRQEVDSSTRTRWAWSKCVSLERPGMCRVPRCLLVAKAVGCVIRFPFWYNLLVDPSAGSSVVAWKHWLDSWPRSRICFNMLLA